MASHKQTLIKGFVVSLLERRLQSYNAGMRIAVFLLVCVMFLISANTITEIPFVGTASLIVPSISLYPAIPQQGDPLLIVVTNPSFLPLRRVVVEQIPLEYFSYHGASAALFGIDLSAATGTQRVSAVFENGEEVAREFSVKERARVTFPLGIPQKLGGNTQASQTQLVINLADENRKLENIKSEPTALWTQDFQAPLASTTVTDSYGYSRLTGDYAIPHKGVDFRAAKGTSVSAMNRGIVRIAESFRVYGNTVVLDHGLGVQTFYMHLSALRVKPGNIVSRGEVIGLSGDSGYAEFPHLHISARIGGVSIDPLVFLSFFSNAVSERN